MPNSTQEKFTARVIPGWVTGLNAVLLATQGLFGFGIHYANVALEGATKPVAGHTLNRSTKPNSAIAGDKGRRLICYEIMNPGPAELSGYYLKMKVAGRYDATKGVFDSGITVERCGACDYECKADGHFTLIEVPSRAGGAQHKLAVNGHVGVLIEAMDVAWTPEEVKLVLPDGTDIPAEMAMASPSWNRGVLDVVRDYGPWAIIAIACCQFGAVVLFGRWLNRRVDSEVDRGAMENEARGYNKGQSDANTPVDKGQDVTGMEQPPESQRLLSGPHSAASQSASEKAGS